MPPKGRPFKVTPATKVSSKAAPAARVPYAPHPPPPREPFSLVGTPSLHLAPSSQPGYCLASSLFFLSEAWVPALRADVEALLCAFEAAWGGGGGGGGAGARAEGSSPCEVMRRLWESMGWKWLHLLGVPQDGAMRAPWGDSVVRAFVEHLTPSEPPLRQAAALMALYLFVATQPASMHRVFIKVDPDMLEYLIALPEQLSAALDSPSPSHALVDPPPSSDLSTVLHSLLTSSSFHLVPPQTFLHPPAAALPLVRAVPDPRTVRRRAQRALALLGAGEEARGLVLGRGRRGGGRKKRRRGRGGEDSESESEEEEEEEDGSGMEDDEAEEEEEGDEDRAVMVPEWDVSVLSRLSSSYHAAKRFRPASPPTHPLAPSSASSPAQPPQPSTLLAPTYTLQAHVLAEAQARTRSAMRDVKAQGLLGDEVPVEDEGADLLRLLDGDRDAGGGTGAVGEFADALRGLLDVRDRMRAPAA